ncbi:MAG: helix-turn-helix transcriptional regulator [Anaerotignum sp.]|nr:helix-turn-helix transcriptional regulator [Anaerotignum sp.]MBQ3615198.1 helix-turn-helix transcriptional regulator [Anaerotignum sp.]MBQ7085487.1 helix-turn-helix transcriptional regulator [Anaerotignum sp.]MBR2851662.1 helix-turn-helix transcriptional regulator [Anaerotignum sp.]
MELLFAKRLRELRKEKGLSQVELGEWLGYGYTAISSYETGRNEPSYTDLIRICEVLDVSADYLLGISHIREPYAVLERNDLIRLHNRAMELARECRRHLEE